MSIREYRQYIEKLKKSRADSSGAKMDLQAPPDNCLDNPFSGEELGYYAELSTSKDINDFRHRIEKIINRLGFTDFSLVPTGTKHNAKSQPLTTLPIKMRNSYYQSKLYEKDIILDQSTRKTGTMLQSTLQDYIEEAPYEDDITLTMQAIFSLKSSFGFYDSYNIFAKTSKGNILFSVTEKGASPYEFREKLDGCKTTLQLLCDAICFVAECKFSTSLLAEPIEQRHFTINQKPLQVLDTLANNDLNITQVASKLCISTVTANKHLEVVRKAFGVKNTIAAIKLAVLSGLIEFEK